MRREDPLAWCAFKGGQGFWSVTRHHDILDLNRNTALLSSARGIRMEDQTYEEYLARRTFQETDPPDHTRTRVLVAKAFSQPVIAQFAEQIRTLCDDILDTALAQGSFDATKDIARQLPMRMLGQILGTPDSDLDWLVEKGDQLIANTDPEFTRHVLDQADTEAYRLMPFRSPAGADLYSYAKELMADKQKRGDTKGVLHLILQPDSHGNVISELEFRNFFCLLVAAGNDTTRYSIAASLYALANRPALMEQLRDGGPSIWETAPDEFIRWASPTMHFRRTATRDFDLHGKTVKEGGQGPALVRLGQPRRRGLRKPVRDRPRAHAEPAYRLRPGWAAYLPRHVAGAARGADPVAGAGEAGEVPGTGRAARVPAIEFHRRHQAAAGQGNLAIKKTTEAYDGEDGPTPSAVLRSS